MLHSQGEEKTLRPFSAAVFFCHICEIRSNSIIFQNIPQRYVRTSAINNRERTKIRKGNKENERAVFFHVYIPKLYV